MSLIIYLAAGRISEHIRKRKEPVKRVFFLKFSVLWRLKYQRRSLQNNKSKIFEDFCKRSGLTKRVISVSAEHPVFISDEEIIRLIIAGDSEKFSTIYKRHFLRIYRIAYRMTGNNESAKDLTQEIFIRAYENLSKFNFRSSFFTWFYRLAHNYSLNYRYKDNRRENQMPEEIFKFDAYHKNEVEENLFKHQLQEQIHKALLTLKPKLRLVIILRDIEGLTYEEVAEQMNLSPGTVASRLSKARSILAGRLAHLREVI